MGDLPVCRVTVPKFPYEHTGTDLFGPLGVIVGRSIAKRWGVLFICMATRACHIEIVPDLSADSFIQCFFRFLSRRGLHCKCLCSDQGTNFIGTYTEFKKLMKRCDVANVVPNYAAQLNKLDRDCVLQCMLRKCVDVKWHFNVPKTPHAGGGWERTIRTIKYVTAAILHNGLNNLPALKCRAPSDFELLSIMCENEAVLNCRPLTKLNSSVEDWRVLTPMSLHTGNLDPAAPVTEFIKADMYRRSYKYVVAVSEQFYDRWLAMYLLWLQIRHRWREVKPNLKVGDLVLLLESKTKERRDFPKAIVVKTFPDAHAHVRQVTVRLADGRTFNRDVRSIVHLEGFCDKDCMSDVDIIDASTGL